MVKIGNYGIGDWTNTNEQDQFDNRLTFDVATQTANLGLRFGVETGYQSNGSLPLPTVIGGMTNFAYIKDRFDKATANASKAWTYGSFLLYEETWGISSRAGWPGGNEKIQFWNIEGSATFAGIEVLALKPWYISKYGAWNETWWVSVKASNNRYDPAITAYSGYHLAQLLKAWNIHMHNLGKKSMFLGFVGIPSTGPSGMTAIGSSDLFPTPAFDELLKFDMLIGYQYPTCSSCAYSGVANRPVSASVDVVKTMREQYGYNGQLVWILTSKFPDGIGTTDINVQQAEFNAVAPYVDIVLVTHKADMMIFPGSILNPPRLISFFDAYSPPPPPAPSVWQCEQPLTGYEIDQYGNKRLNSICNVPKRYSCSGAPFYQCNEDVNGQYATLEECNTACAIQRPGLSSIVVSPGTATILVGENIIAIGTAIDSNGNTMGGIPIVWSSDPAGIVEIDPINTATFIDGKISTKIKGISAGMVMVKGTSGSISGQLIVDVNVAPPPPPPPPPPPVEPPKEEFTSEKVIGALVALAAIAKFA